MANEGRTYDISANGKYSVGMRFMNYLDNVYGSHSKWIKYYESIDPYYANKYADQKIDINKQYNVLKITYGNNVFNGFYNWLRNNEKKLYQDPISREYACYDLTKLQYTYLYPYFYNNGNRPTLNLFHVISYNNLYISIEETRNYLYNYKKKDVSNLRIIFQKEIEVSLYDSNDNLIMNKIDDEFSLVGVAYIKLVGEGKIGDINEHGLKILW